MIEAEPGDKALSLRWLWSGFRFDLKLLSVVTRFIATFHLLFAAVTPLAISFELIFFTEPILELILPLSVWLRL